jgi:hypothetical protein
VTVGGSQFVSCEDFPKVARKIDTIALAQYRKVLQELKRKGVVLRGGNGREPVVPGEPVSIGRPQGRPLRPGETEETPYFLNAYPEARNLSTGIFWKFLEKETQEYFRRMPEIDSIRNYVWETPLLNDTNYFRDFYWADISKTLHTVNLGHRQFYSDADYLTQMISAIARGAHRAGKEYQFWPFCHYPWQERLNIAAIKQLDRNLPVSLFHFCQMGDWNPIRPNNNVMMEITDRESTISFDVNGEYWGVSLIPYCYPEKIRQRLVQALDHNPNLTTIAGGGARRDSYNDVNSNAITQPAHDPYMPIEQIWRAWAEKRFGKAAAPKVISALQRTDEVGNLIFYFRGMLTSEHSLTPDVDYLEGQSLHFSRANMEWMPQDFENNFLLKEFQEHPREHIIEVVTADRAEALRLNALSLEDVEAARPDLPSAEYNKLKYQLALQSHWAEESIPHTEAFLRYKIQKWNPSKDNLAKLDKVLQALETKAVEVEKLYQEKVEILTAERNRSYLKQVRAAVAVQPQR